MARSEGNASVIATSTLCTELSELYARAADIVEPFGTRNIHISSPPTDVTNIAASKIPSGST
jgi:hypothetical protein